MILEQLHGKRKVGRRRAIHVGRRRAMYGDDDDGDGDGDGDDDDEMILF